MDKVKLTWVLQSNAIGEVDQHVLSDCILKSGHAVELLRVIPFSHEPADPLPTIEGPCIVYGSSGLVKLGHAASWLPCGWDGNAFEIDEVNRSLGEFALNSGALRTTWSQTYDIAKSKNWDSVFVRPVSETKEFPGQVFKTRELKDWVEKLNSSGYFDTNDNPAMVGPELALGREWRVFVVGGKQIAGCQYANRRTSESRNSLPIEVSNFVEQSLQTYNPAPCFVIDIAEVFEDETWVLKVVEYNSINSAGFYECDKLAIVTELSSFVLSNFGN